MDAAAVYKSLLREEESRTGEPSATRFPDADMATILADGEVASLRAQRMATLRDLGGQVLRAIHASADKMPFGMRWISQQLHAAILDRFPRAGAGEADKVVLHLLYYRYMNPVLVAPESFDVLEQQDISPLQRRNLAEVAKLLQQVSSYQGATSTTSEDAAEQRAFLETGRAQFLAWVHRCAQVPAAEEHFGMHEFVDLSRKGKLNILISTEEVYQIHARLLQHAGELVGVVRPSTAHCGWN